MALNASAVRIGISGAVYVAPTTTAAPTTSTIALNAAFVDLGYVSSDGVEENYDSKKTDIEAWQNGVIVRSVESGGTATLKFTLIETKGKVLEAFHKTSTVAVVSAGQWKIDVKASGSDPRSWVLDVVDGAKHIRLYVPTGEIFDRGAIKYANDQEIGYDVTVTCYPDANNVLLTKFSDDSLWGYS